MSHGAPTMTRADALTVWIAARERARDALLAEAAGLSRQGLASEAGRCRSAARLLAIQATKERAQAGVPQAADAPRPSPRPAVRRCDSPNPARGGLPPKGNASFVPFHSISYSELGAICGANKPAEKERRPKG